MTRALKPQKADEFHHERLGVRVDLMFDRNQKDFYAVVVNEALRAPSIVELRKLVRIAVEKNAELRWYQIIVVWLPTDTWGATSDRGFARCSFKHERYEVADRADGQRVQRPFRENGVKPDNGIHRGNENNPDLDLVEKFYGGGREHARNLGNQKPHVFELPYSDEVWGVLERMAGSLRKAATDLDNLLRSSDLEMQLKNLATRASTTVLLTATTTTSAAPVFSADADESSA